MRIIPTALLALTALVTAKEASGDPLKYPRRMVDGNTVELGPLFSWWNRPRGCRPLTAWVRVTGSIVATNAWGWTVNALIEERPADKKGDGRDPAAARKQTKIVLKNPPIEELVQFETLTARLKTLNSEHDRLSAEIQQAQKHLQNIASRQSANRQSRGRSRNLAQEHRRWSQSESDAKASLETVDKQIKDVNSKLAGYSNRSHYLVDCLAVKVPQAFLNLPVYDRGAIIQ